MTWDRFWQAVPFLCRPRGARRGFGQTLTGALGKRRGELSLAQCTEKALSFYGSVTERPHKLWLDEIHVRHPGLGGMVSSP